MAVAHSPPALSGTQQHSSSRLSVWWAASPTVFGCWCFCQFRNCCATDRPDTVTKPSKPPVCWPIVFTTRRISSNQTGEAPQKNLGPQKAQPHWLDSHSYMTLTPTNLYSLQSIRIPRCDSRDLLCYKTTATPAHCRLIQKELPYGRAIDHTTPTAGAQHVYAC